MPVVMHIALRLIYSFLRILLIARVVLIILGSHFCCFLFKNSGQHITATSGTIELTLHLSLLLFFDGILSPHGAELSTLEQLNDARKQVKFSLEFSIVALLNSLNHVFISILDAFGADLAVLLQLAKTDWAEGAWLLIGLSDEIGAVHEALEVGAVGHTEHVAYLVTGGLQAAINEDFFLRIKFWLLHLIFPLLIAKRP